MARRVRIETSAQAAAARERLRGLEERFRACVDQASARLLAREIIGLHMALTSYALRIEMRAIHDHQAG